MNKGFRWIIFAIITILIVIIVLSGFLLLSTDKIVSNVYINGIEVSGLTKNEALLKLKESYGEILQNSSMTLSFEGINWNLDYNDIDYSYDFDTAINSAYSIGRTGNIVNRYFSSIRSKFADNEITLSFSYNENNVLQIIDNIAKNINRVPVDATIRLKSGKFVITPETIGLKLNSDIAFDLIKSRIEDSDISVVELPIEKLPPDIKKSDLENITEKLGEYTTKFDVSNKNRTYNIALATSSVTDVLVNPHEVFSLNKIIGSRLEEKGYKMAKVIINNEYVDGIGGGLCQISTTLYNAALLSNMKIVERKNHSLPSEYVGLGRDATISGDYIDMKFENNTDSPIYIHGDVKGNKVTFSIYGKKENPNRSIEIRTSVIKKIEPQVKIIEDDTLPIGTEVIEKKAIAGYVVKSYRVVMENGKVLFTEPLYTDSYRVSDEVKRVGTKPVNMMQEGNGTINLEDLNTENLNL